MPARHTRSTRAARQTLDLALTAPQVVAHRLGRLAQSGGVPSARVQHELWTMGTEKVVAFQQAWFAMWVEAGRIQQQMMVGTLTALWFPWLKALPGPRAMQAQWRNAALDIAAKGIAPVQRRAAANLRRLSRR